MKKARTKQEKIILACWIVIGGPIALLLLLLLLVRIGVFGTLPTFEELESPKSNLATELISADGELLGTYYIQNRTFVDYKDLSPYLVQALIATEDSRFRAHSGIDFTSLGRVAFKTILLGGKQGGGSTISQQLAKNLYPRNIDSDDGKIVRMGKTVISKLKEWITAVMLERNYTKEEIIVMYFNVVEYGSNAFGIKSASQTFFNTQPSELKIEEAALLVGVINAPTRYSPVNNYDRAIARRNLVLHRMEQDNMISRKACDSLTALPINLKFNPTSHNQGISTYFRAMVSKYLTATEPVRSEYGSKWDYQKAKELWDEDPLYGWCNKNHKSDGTPYNLYRDGLKIYTTIDAQMQRYAEQAVESHLKNTIQPQFEAQKKATGGKIFYGISKDQQETIIRNAIRWSDRYRTLKEDGATEEEIMRDFHTPVRMRVFSYDEPMGKTVTLSPYDSILYHKGILRGSFVAMEPGTGFLKAYVGGNSFRYFKYDMAMQGKRQVGSTIKPFIYTFAVDHLGISPCTPVPNSPVSVDGWSPKESGKVEQNGEYHPLWWGLAKSRNNYSAWIIKQSNYQAVADLINSFGVSSYIEPVPSMCLGTADISLYEMVSAYSSFANMGIHTSPIFITRIEDKHGNMLASFTPTTTEPISEQSAYTVLSMMQKVTDYGGTGARLRTNYRITGEVGGKTGTTQSGSDGWFIAVTPRLAAGAWVGGEDRSIHLFRSAEGSRLALPIVGAFLRSVYDNPSLGISESERFVRPAGAAPLDCHDDFTRSEGNDDGWNFSPTRTGDEADFFE